MIHLDTNYLIGLVVAGSREATDVDGWLAAGQVLAVSAIAWSEFLNTFPRYFYRVIQTR